MVERAPAPRPDKSVRQLLQELANANMVTASVQAFQVIDHHARRAKKKLSGLGIAAGDELVDAAADAIKRKAVELATGRKQPQ